MIATRSKIEGRRVLTPAVDHHPNSIHDHPQSMNMDDNHHPSNNIDYQPSSSTGNTFSFNPSTSQSFVFNQESIDQMSSLDLGNTDDQTAGHAQLDHEEDDVYNEKIDYDDVLSASDT